MGHFLHYHNPPKMPMDLPFPDNVFSPHFYPNHNTRGSHTRPPYQYMHVHPWATDYDGDIPEFHRLPGQNRDNLSVAAHGYTGEIVVFDWLGNRTTINLDEVHTTDGVERPRYSFKARFPILIFDHRDWGTTFHNRFINFDTSPPDYTQERMVVNTLEYMRMGHYHDEQSEDIYRYITGAKTLSCSYIHRSASIAIFWMTHLAPLLWLTYPEREFNTSPRITFERYMANCSRCYKCVNSHTCTICRNPCAKCETIPPYQRDKECQDCFLTVPCYRYKFRNGRILNPFALSFMCKKLPQNGPYLEPMTPIECIMFDNIGDVLEHSDDDEDCDTHNSGRNFWLSHLYHENSRFVPENKLIHQPGFAHLKRSLQPHYFWPEEIRPNDLKWEREMICLAMNELWKLQGLRNFFTRYEL